MNDITLISQMMEEAEVRQMILVAMVVVALIFASYNWLYLYHSLRVSSKHMGLNAPAYIRQIIKLSIFLSIITAGLSLFLLLIGRY